MLRNFLKYLASFSPFPLTRNEYYDRLTEQIIKKVCNKSSVCVDVGANEGKILRMFIKHCPQAIHYSFEPIPELYFLLVRKYGSAARIFKLALADKKGFSDFSYTVDDPAYSSLHRRSFSTAKVTKQLKVETDLLDNLIPETENVTLIKLDIEGGEYDALVGSQKIIKRCKPCILFEFGKGGADAFNITPGMFYEFFKGLGYSLNLLKNFLEAKASLSLTAFEDEYEKGREYFFIAYPLA